MLCDVKVRIVSGDVKHPSDRFDSVEFVQGEANPKYSDFHRCIARKVIIPALLVQNSVISI